MARRPLSPTAGGRRGGGAQVLALLGFLVLTLGVGQIGGEITRPALETWYAGLVKPWFTPPDLAFPIVWTALFVLMAVSAWLVWRDSGFSRAAAALTLFLVQLAANLAWTYLFFGLRSPLYGLLDIAMLLALIAATVLAFARHNHVAAWLLVPYIVWVAYAGVLNFAIWRLNA